MPMYLYVYTCVYSLLWPGMRYIYWYRYKHMT